MEAAEDPGIDIEENNIYHQIHERNTSYTTPDLGIVKLEVMDVEYGDKFTADKGLDENEPSTSTSPIIQINNADSTTDDIKKEPVDIEMDFSNNMVTSSLNNDVFATALIDPSVANTEIRLIDKIVTPNDESDDIVIPNILSVHSVSLETHKNVDNEPITFEKFDAKDYEEKCFNSYINLIDIGPSLMANDNFCDTCEILFPEHNSFSQHKMTQHSHFVMIDYKDTSEDDLASTSSSNFKSKFSVPGKSCPKCDKKFTQRFNMIRHWKLCRVLPVVKNNDANEEIVETKLENLCKICNKTFGTRFELIKHLYDHVSTNVTQKYKCDFCTDSFDEKSKLESHLWKHVEKNLKKVESDSTESIIKKEIVKLENPKSEKFQNNRTHVACFENWRKKFLVCEKCDCQFIKSSYYIRHLISDHTLDKKFIIRPLNWRKDGQDGIKFVHCNVCKCSFRYTAHYNKHRAGVHLKGTPCKGCGFETASLYNCWKHRKNCKLYMAKMAELHRSILKCEGCSKVMPSFRTMGVHIKVCKAVKNSIKSEPGKVKTESKKVEYNCKKCMLKFEKHGPYYKHMVKHGVIAPLRMTIKKSEKTVPCYNKKFVPTKTRLPNTLYKCTPCGAHFHDTSGLVRHRKCTHLQNMRIVLRKCTLCKLAFTITTLKRHRAYPHKNRTFKVIPDTDFLPAEQMNVKFNKIVHRNKLFPVLGASVKLPINIKPLKPGPDKNSQVSTKQAYNMVSQILTRNKNILFKCILCDVYFNGLYVALNMHVRLHKNKTNWIQKRYNCDICPAKFTCQTALGVHKRFYPKSHTLNNFTVYNLDKHVYNLDKTPSGVIYKLSEKIMGNTVSNAPVVISKKQKNFTVYRCENCKVHFHECPSVVRHKPQCSRQDLVRFPCNICDLLFSKKSIAKHRQLHRANPKLTRDSFKIKGVIETDRENHNKRKPHKTQLGKTSSSKHKTIYKCSHCDLHFNVLKTANQHVEKHLNSSYDVEKRQKRTCGFCGMVFDPNSIDHHIQLHHKHNVKTNIPSFTIKTLSTQSLKEDKSIRPSYNIPFPVKIRIKKLVESKVEQKKENTQVIVETITYKCDLCPKRYATRSALILHSKIDHIDESPCPICRCLLLSSTINEKHLKVFNNMFECCLCKNVLELSLLNSHAKEHDNSYNCRNCAQSFPSLELLDAHLDEQHPEGLTFPGVDDSVDSPNSTSNTSAHKSKGSRSKMLKYGDQKVNLRQCVFCEFSSYDQSLYAKHMAKEHKDDANDLDCAQCGAIFNKPHSLIRHLELKRCKSTNL